jgi:hypothetical protein
MKSFKRLASAYRVSRTVYIALGASIILLVSAGTTIGIMRAHQPLAQSQESTSAQSTPKATTTTNPKSPSSLDQSSGKTAQSVQNSTAKSGSTLKPSTGSAPSSSTPSGGSTSGSSGGSDVVSTPGTLYVRPGTQGYREALSALTVYSAANGQVPPGTSCAWNQTYKYLRCNDTNLTLDHVYIEGGLYWAGCGSLAMSNSIFDWYPSQSWFDVYNACTTPNAGATITAIHTTFETSPSIIHYTGGSDIGGIAEYTGDVPMYVSNSLIQGFSQGLDPGGGSVISSTEIYVQDNICSGGAICHGDGLFSQGGDNIIYQNNYIVTPGDATSAIFYQSQPNSNGNSVSGNYLQGGSYALYNQNSSGLKVENNTFGGSTYGNCSLTAANGASWSVWSGNVTLAGIAVVPKGNGCT